MPHNDDKQIWFPLPFLKETTVLYVGGGYGGVTDIVERNLSEYRLCLYTAGYSLLYLPDLSRMLSWDMMRYFFPGQKPAMVDSLYRQIHHLTETKDVPGFLYQWEGNTYFHELTGPDAEAISADVEELIKRLQSHREEPVMFSVKRSDPLDACYDLEVPLVPNEGAPKARRRRKVLFSKRAVIEEPVVEFDEPLDDRTQAIIRQWEEIERRYGISIDELATLLNYRVQLSRLTITTAGKIYLSNLPGSPEVKMDDLTKSVYLFYLRHPEGCPLKEVYLHEKEIRQIYERISGRDDPRAIKESVHNFVDPYKNNLNVCFSRIKKAFKDIVSDNIARNYYVDGRYGEVRTIRIDRDLVIWEH